MAKNRYLDRSGIPAAIVPVGEQCYDLSPVFGPRQFYVPISGKPTIVQPQPKRSL